MMNRLSSINQTCWFNFLLKLIYCDLHIIQYYYSIWFLKKRKEKCDVGPVIGLFAFVSRIVKVMKNRSVSSVYRPGGKVIPTVRFLQGRRGTCMNQTRKKQWGRVKNSWPNDGTQWMITAAINLWTIIKLKKNEIKMEAVCADQHLNIKISK